mmetsp:Transcript_23507/g.60305  ORF Transcript_23507/g.60305 Transcript_23507/m.60305 type:complete len:372 (-) Transcript_23507:494-1609(-)
MSELQQHGVKLLWSGVAPRVTGQTTKGVGAASWQRAAFWARRAGSSAGGAAQHQPARLQVHQRAAAVRPRALQHIQASQHLLHGRRRRPPCRARPLRPLVRLVAPLGHRRQHLGVPPAHQRRRGRVHRLRPAAVAEVKHLGGAAVEALRQRGARGVRVALPQQRQHQAHARVGLAAHRLRRLQRLRQQWLRRLPVPCAQGYLRPQERHVGGVLLEVRRRQQRAQRLVAARLRRAAAGRLQQLRGLLRATAGEVHESEVGQARPGGAQLGREQAARRRRAAQQRAQLGAIPLGTHGGERGAPRRRQHYRHAGLRRLLRQQRGVQRLQRRRRLRIPLLARLGQQRARMPARQPRPVRLLQAARAVCQRLRCMV